MNIPHLVDNKALADLASPTDALCVRVVLRRVQNNAPYRLHGKLRIYLATYDRDLCAHVLDVPLSVWMHGFPATGAYRDNPSIAHDLQGNRSQGMSPLVFLVVPWKLAAAPAVAVPAASAASPPAAAAQDTPAPVKANLTAAERMRKMRAAKAAKAANLEPATA